MEWQKMTTKEQTWKTFSEPFEKNCMICKWRQSPQFGMCLHPSVDHNDVTKNACHKIDPYKSQPLYWTDYDWEGFEWNGIR